MVAIGCGWASDVGEVGQQRPPRSFWRKAGFALAFMLLLACVPALWLIGRDVIRLAIASDRTERDAYQSEITLGLLSEIDRTATIAGGGRTFVHLAVVPTPCYAVPVSAITAYDPLSSQVIADGVLSDFNFRLTAVGVAAKRYFRDVARFQHANRAFSPLQASALRACIAASPFASKCVGHVEGVLRQDDAEFERLAVEWGLMIPLRSDQRNGEVDYCQTVPLQLVPANP